MVRSTSRGLLLVGTLWSAPALAQLPHPPAGEYRCTQSDIALAGVSSTGLPAATAVVARPGMMGNLVIDRMGGYRMTATNASRASYRYESTGARVIFTGQLAGLSNSYGTRGRNVFFDFSNASIGFSSVFQFDVRGVEIVFIVAQGGVAIGTLGGGGVRNVPAYGNNRNEKCVIQRDAALSVLKGACCDMTTAPMYAAYAVAAQCRASPADKPRSR
jgi:hypothetical protein